MLYDMTAGLSVFPRSFILSGSGARPAFPSPASPIPPPGPVRQRALRRKLEALAEDLDQTTDAAVREEMQTMKKALQETTPVPGETRSGFRRRFPAGPLPE